MRLIVFVALVVLVSATVNFATGAYEIAQTWLLLGIFCAVLDLK